MSGPRFRWRLTRRGLAYLAVAFMCAIAGFGVYRWKTRFLVSNISSNFALAAMSDGDLAERAMKRVIVGMLELPDGALVATDPLVMPERPAFTRKAPPGRYETSVIISTPEGRNAAAIIRFSNGIIVRWELAVIPGQDVTSLRANAYFGIPVDAGMAAFASSQFFDAVQQREKDERQKHGKRFNYYNNVISSEQEKSENHAWIHRPVADREGADAAVFDSGWGDGYYPVFWGLDASDRPVVAMIDFQIVENADARTPEWWREKRASEARTPSEIELEESILQAIRAGDAATIERLLKEGRITLSTYLPSIRNTVLGVAVVWDKPAILEVSIARGARDLMPATIYGQKHGDTYSGKARDRQRRALDPDDAKRNGFKIEPLSAETMRLIEILARRP